MPAAPETLALYLTDLAGLAKTRTVARRLAAIGEVHRTVGLPFPTTNAASGRPGWPRQPRRRGPPASEAGHRIPGDGARLLAAPPGDLPASTRQLLQAARDRHGSLGAAAMAALRGAYEHIVTNHVPEPVGPVGPFPAPRTVRRREHVDGL